jgi:hypothetical protein
MFSSLALDERTMKFCEKTSETLRNALDIFFRRRILGAALRRNVQEIEEGEYKVIEASAGGKTRVDE